MSRAVLGTSVGSLAPQFARRLEQVNALLLVRRVAHQVDVHHLNVGVHDVFDLRDDMQRRPGGIACQRDREADPDDVSVAVEITFLHLINPPAPVDQFAQQRRDRHHARFVDGQVVELTGHCLQRRDVGQTTREGPGVESLAQARARAASPGGLFACPMSLRQLLMLRTPLLGGIVAAAKGLRA